MHSATTRRIYSKHRVVRSRKVKRITDIVGRVVNARSTRSNASDARLPIQTLPIQHSQPTTSNPTTSSPSSTSFTSPLHRQKSEVATNDRPCKEVRTREATIFLRLVQISKRTIGSSLVQPFRYTLEDDCASLWRRDGGGLELPVGFRVQVARVEGELILHVSCCTECWSFDWRDARLTPYFCMAVRYHSDCVW